MDEPTAALSRPDVDALHGVIRQLASERHHGRARLALPRRGARVGRRGDDPARRPPRADRARRRADRGVADGGDARPVAGRDVPGQAARSRRARAPCSRSATWSRPASTESRSTCGRERSSAWPAWSARAGPRSRGRSTGRTACTPDRSPSRSGDKTDARQVNVTGTPRTAMRAGVLMIPESRKEQGLLLGRPVRENVSLSTLAQVSRSRHGSAGPGATDRARDARPGRRPRRRPVGPGVRAVRRQPAEAAVRPVAAERSDGADRGRAHPRAWTSAPSGPSTSC